MPELLDDYLLTNYDYELPKAQIAQEAPNKRGDSRLLIMPRNELPGGLESLSIGIKHTLFSQIADNLPRNALLVANNSKVLPARLRGRRKSGAKLEFLLLTPLPLVIGNNRKIQGACLADSFHEAEAEGLLRCGAKIAPGEELDFECGIGLTAVEAIGYGRYRVLLRWQGSLAEIFASAGEIPLPPYIKRKVKDVDSHRYQTVFAKEDKTGSVAAPTAGLHFTSLLREQLLAKGYGWTELTLYVGYGTFSPIRCPNIRAHQMHAEYVEISADCVSAIVEAKRQGRPVIAVGTTAVRALEGSFELLGALECYSGWLENFIYPGKHFQIIDGLLTNFHLPCSSLLVLVAAFAGRERVLHAYREAISMGYRFFSYGDAMLIF